jgi:hypothetical protein
MVGGNVFQGYLVTNIHWNRSANIPIRARASIFEVVLGVALGVELCPQLRLSHYRLWELATLNPAFP